MFSPVFQRLLIISNSFAFYLYVTRIKFDLSKELFFVPSSLRTIQIKILATLQLAVMLWFTGRTTQIYFSASNNTAEVALAYIICILYASVSFIFLVELHDLGNYPIGINLLYRYLVNFKSNVSFHELSFLLIEIIVKLLNGFVEKWIISMPSYRRSPTGLKLDVILVLLFTSVGLCVPVYITIFTCLPDFSLFPHTLFIISPSPNITVYHITSFLSAMAALFAAAGYILQQATLAVFFLRK